MKVKGSTLAVGAVLLGVGGYFGWRWYQGRKSGSRPATTTKPASYVSKTAATTKGTSSGSGTFRNLTGIAGLVNDVRDSIRAGGGYESQPYDTYAGSTGFSWG